MAGSWNPGDPATPLEGPLKARKQLADDGFEQWLYAPDDDGVPAEETEQQALEAEWAEEDLKLRIRTAGYISIPAGFIGLGILSLFTTSPAAQTFLIWVVINIPLLPLAVVTWRRRELRFGLKRPIKGRKARIMVAILVLSSGASFALAMAHG